MVQAAFGLSHRTWHSSDLRHNRAGCRMFNLPNILYPFQWSFPLFPLFFSPFFNSISWTNNNNTKDNDRQQSIQTKTELWKTRPSKCLHQIEPISDLQTKTCTKWPTHFGFFIWTIHIDPCKLAHSNQPEQTYPLTLTGTNWPSHLDLTNRPTHPDMNKLTNSPWPDK